YNDAHRRRRARPAGSVGHLISVYKGSHEFSRLAPRTKEDYLRHIRRLEERWGEMPIDALSHPRARGSFKVWRDELAETSPKQADYAWIVLARILSVAKDRGLIAVNPCERGGQIYHADRTEKIWSDDDLARFRAVASSDMRLALDVALG